jgi:nucleotide-binding universal stress UspA family protein
MEYNNILVPLDGSKFSRKAVLVAANLATIAKTNLLLFAVVEPITSQLEGYAEFVSGADLYEQIRTELQAMLDEEAERLAAGGYLVSTKLEEGFANEAIVETCESEAIDLVVMTTHGRKGVAHWFMGSVTEKVVRCAPCSVLVVRQPSS